MSEPDQEQQQKAEKQLEELAVQRAQQALRLASASLPHLAGLVRLARLKPSRRVPVAAVAASGLTLVHPELFAKMPMADATFVLAHELMHLALDTHGREEGTHPLVANFAHDYIINDILREELERDPPLQGLDWVGAREKSFEELVVELSQSGQEGSMQCWQAGQPPTARRAAPSPISRALEDAGLIEPEPPPEPPQLDDQLMRGDVLPGDREDEFEPEMPPELRRKLTQQVRKAAAKAASLSELKKKMEAAGQPATVAEPDEVFPDWGTAAVQERRDTMRGFHRRLEDMAVTEWDLSQQAEYLAVRSRFDQQLFTLMISRPWSRDPGFYVDRMLRVTFADLPLAGDDLAEVQSRLGAIPGLVDQAKRNLTEVAADYADLAIFNLTNADGVGHGYPYRATPPAGVLGWYTDFLGRARNEQPELVADIEAARDSIQSYHDWLVDHRADMTGRAGVGKAAFDWYLKHVKLMPYDSDDIVLLGERELDRLWSVYALERHRNRDLPEIEISSSAEEYAGPH